VAPQPGDEQHPDADGRAQALRQAVRLVRPGGRLRIVDDGAHCYPPVLRQADCTGAAVQQRLADVVRPAGPSHPPGHSHPTPTRDHPLTV